MDRMSRDRVARNAREARPLDRGVLTERQCRDLLAGHQIGRVAICTPHGPLVLPVSYVLDGSSLVFRTTPYGDLGRGASGGRLALETDHVDVAAGSAWSVLARGTGSVIEDLGEIALVRAFRDPQPWAPGTRLLYVRLVWDELTGRRFGSS
jgi:nitroimidazol reductase NimA-like FMN-containing flavoprotein (pyridoxamine 5'-phosphate oxidase superfamily)